MSSGIKPTSPLPPLFIPSDESSETSNAWMEVVNGPRPRSPSFSQKLEAAGREVRSKITRLFSEILSANDRLYANHHPARLLHLQLRY